jgi:excisionase family DNA binding protein
MRQGKTFFQTGDAERRAVSVDEVAAELGVSAGLVRLELGRGQLKGTRFGRRVLIMRSDLEDYLTERAGR